MYTVYVLKDSKGRLYKGFTNDITRRMKEHQSGHTQTTRGMIGLDILYTETYEDMDVARGREVYLKSSAGRRFLKKILLR
ncbi:MAG: endonuclease [Candidatus Vogelbacteria bacterium CG10_big_fil_rev_8_21_14_0_10_45_14]|uniref:Endonuclease n=1 Tax=Candidatus Vogelbacteria bacterium CG10_big_fil_rev_8_21_14_0_10_45_14 TaxID=1975042 RepID=A0A2H0RLT3_9BACT|nr:MAG: endonuclease [Candidatus Vogelbacteria bacterium CG10_big_fil_rev_8_21_14_0_10_45_14]